MNQAAPISMEDWIKETQRPLADLVEEVHAKLLQNPEYRRLLRARWDNQAVEGSLACDNTMAALLIRDLAKQDGCSDVADQKLAVIVKALGKVMQRHGMGRKQRRNAAGEDDTD